jgi:hypothetical protein
METAGRNKKYCRFLADIPSRTALWPSYGTGILLVKWAALLSHDSYDLAKETRLGIAEPWDTRSSDQVKIALIDTTVMEPFERLVLQTVQCSRLLGGETGMGRH